jgi:hypothetical protein
MVAPVTSGPTYNISGAQPPGSYLAGNQNYRKRVILNQRQVKPYTLPLSYSIEQWLWKVEYTHYPSPWELGLNPARSFDNPPSVTTNAATKAYGKFREAAYGDMASWAVNIVQYRESFDLMTSSILGLHRAVRNLRRGNVSGLIDQFSLPKGFKPKGRTFASRWLEWSFGIRPLIQDVGASVEALKRDFNPKVVKVSGSGRNTWSGSDFLSPGVTQVYSGVVTQNCHMGGTITVTNPNALLWTSLGLTNPLAVVYDAIPFSFVVNYFISIEPWIQGLSPWYGVSLSNTYTSIKTVRAGQVHHVGRPSGIPANQGFGSKINGEMVTFTRSPGALATPGLRVRDPWIISPGRAANAVSLLLQQLRR